MYMLFNTLSPSSLLDVPQIFLVLPHEGHGVGGTDYGAATGGTRYLCTCCCSPPSLPPPATQIFLVLPHESHGVRGTD